MVLNCLFNSSLKLCTHSLNYILAMVLSSHCLLYYLQTSLTRPNYQQYNVDITIHSQKGIDKHITSNVKTHFTILQQFSHIFCYAMKNHLTHHLTSHNQDVILCILRHKLRSTCKLFLRRNSPCIQSTGLNNSLNALVYYKYAAK